jgi:uncharacterized membrane protein YozB (DUF420 family)
MTSAMIFQIQSGIILFLMYLGIYFRRARKIHVGLMSVVIIWDIILILQIELTRNAVAKATEAMKNPMLLNIHIAIAVSTVVLYILQIFSGRKMLKGFMQRRGYHRKLGMLTATLRTLTFITSFFAVS